MTTRGIGGEGRRGRCEGGGKRGKGMEGEEGEVAGEGGDAPTQ